MPLVGLRQPRLQPRLSSWCPGRTRHRRPPLAISLTVRSDRDRRPRARAPRLRRAAIPVWPTNR
jgi:hypothetical protein